MPFNVEAMKAELEQKGSLAKGYDSYKSACKKHRKTREERRKIQQTIRNAENEIAYAILTSEKK